MSEENSTSDIPTENTEESKPTETSQVLSVFNKISSQDKSVAEIESYTKNGEQNNGKDNQLLSTNFQFEVENRKAEVLIMYSMDQQIFKFEVNSGNNHNFIKETKQEQQFVVFFIN